MSQNADILAHLKKGKTITPLEALERFDCLRLSGRIYDLKELGHNIVSERRDDPKTGKHYAEYRLA